LTPTEQKGATLHITVSSKTTFRILVFGWQKWRWNILHWMEVWIPRIWPTQKFL